MTHLWKIEDISYKWLNIDGRECLKVNDYIIELPELSLPENARYVGPLLQGLYGRHRPFISRRLQLLLLMTLDHNPNYFQTVTKRKWYCFEDEHQKSCRPRKIVKKQRKSKAKVRVEPYIVELD